MSLKKIVFFSILIASFFVMNSLSHSIYTLLQKNQLVVNAREELVGEKQQNQALKQKLSIVQKPQFVEEEARNKLFLAKPGEGVLVVPTIVLGATSAGKKKHEDKRPNWQQWWRLFFY